MKKINIKLPQIKIPKIIYKGIDIIKNLMFFAFYIFITLISIGVIIAPSIKKYKKSQKEYLTTKETYDIIYQQYTNALNSLKKAKKENNTILLKFKRDFDSKNFKFFMTNYMNISKIEKNSTSIYKKNFLVTSYFIHSTIKSPKNFYDFIDSIKKYKNVLRVYFPVNFKKEKEINLVFKLEHYKLKNKNTLEEIK